MTADVIIIDNFGNENRSRRCHVSRATVTASPLASSVTLAVSSVTIRRHAVPSHVTAARVRPRRGSPAVTAGR